MQAVHLHGGMEQEFWLDVAVMEESHVYIYHEPPSSAQCFPLDVKQPYIIRQREIVQCHSVTWMKG